MEAKEFIKKRSLYTGHLGYPVISVGEAFDAIDMAREEMKAKAIEALDSVLDRYVHGGDADYILEEFKIKLEDKQ